jgi:ribosomal-protein-alanine N-acetyltransferase
MSKMMTHQATRTELRRILELVPAPAPVVNGWRQQLPVLSGMRVELRQLETSDAPALQALLSTPEVCRFVSPPPPSIAAFERFIERARSLQAAGAGLCYAVVLRDSQTTVGLVQMRETEPRFAVAEWGFALGVEFWGTGIFEEVSELVLAFAFEQLGVHRLESRVVVQNGRGMRAMQKVGAVQEGVLRRSFLKEGRFLDQALFAIVDEDWRFVRRPASPVVH